MFAEDGQVVGDRIFRANFDHIFRWFYVLLDRILSKFKILKYSEIQVEFPILVTLLIKELSIMVRISLKQQIYNRKRITTAQRVKIDPLFYRNNNSVRTVYRLLWVKLIILLSEHNA